VALTLYLSSFPIHHDVWVVEGKRACRWSKRRGCTREIRSIFATELAPTQGRHRKGGKKEGRCKKVKGKIRTH